MLIVLNSRKKPSVFSLGQNNFRKFFQEFLGRNSERIFSLGLVPRAENFFETFTGFFLKKNPKKFSLLFFPLNLFCPPSLQF